MRNYGNEYGDEGFIRLLRDRQEEVRNRDIQKGSVWAGDKELVFKEYEVIKKQLFIYIPDEFALLAKETARQKYPYENRPEIIYADPQGSVTVAFTHRKEKLDTGQEEEVRNAIAQVMRQLYPSGIFMEKQSVVTYAAQMPVAWFDFVTPAIDADIYNLMFFYALNGKLLMGACNCLQADQEEWKEFFVQMIKTLRSA